MTYRCEHFRIGELVPPSYAGQVDADVLWCLLDDRILRSADRLRQRYGKCFVNTWPFGGSLELCGWRPATSPVGARWSDHKWGRALDLHFETVEAAEIRADIRANPWREAFELITAIEADVDWLHIACRNRDKRNAGLLIISPGG
jgi:hypothetical protein